MKALLAFLAMFVMDFVWAKYTTAIAEKRAMPAASWAILITLLSGYVITSYVNDPWMLAPAAAGAFAGTYAAVIWEKR